VSRLSSSVVDAVIASSRRLTAVDQSVDGCVLCLPRVQVDTDETCPVKNWNSFNRRRTHQHRPAVTETSPPASMMTTLHDD